MSLLDRDFLQNIRIGGDLAYLTLHPPWFILCIWSSNSLCLGSFFLLPHNLVLKSAKWRFYWILRINVRMLIKRVQGWAWGSEPQLCRSSNFFTDNTDFFVVPCKWIFFHRLLSKLTNEVTFFSLPGKWGFMWQSFYLVINLDPNSVEMVRKGPY